MSDYHNDIFISYSRVGATSEWLRRHLVPMLSERLELELGREPSIFFDNALNAGGTWPVELGRELARSRVLLALWSKPYLTSHWCAREMAIMRARENSLNLRSPHNPNGTIFISIIHDGETMPDTLEMIQKSEIKEFYNTRMVTGGQKAEGLMERLTTLAPDLATMIEAAPPYRSQWEHETADAFFQAFHDQIGASQTSTPRYTS